MESRRTFMSAVADAVTPYARAAGILLTVDQRHNLMLWRRESLEEIGGSTEEAIKELKGDLYSGIGI
jgi:hypothetical protein